MDHSKVIAKPKPHCSQIEAKFPRPNQADAELQPNQIQTAAYTKPDCSLTKAAQSKTSSKIKLFISQLKPRRGLTVEMTRLGPENGQISLLEVLLSLPRAVHGASCKLYLSTE
jgi:hypothetical protein